MPGGGVVTTLPPFYPSRAVFTPRPGQVPFSRGALAPNKVRPWPHLLYLEPQVQQPPTHTLLKLISDLRPWGIQDIPKNTHSLSSPVPPPPRLLPQPLSLCHLSPPETPQNASPLFQSGQAGRSWTPGPWHPDAGHARCLGGSLGRAGTMADRGWWCMLAEEARVLPPGGWARPPL